MFSHDAVSSDSRDRGLHGLRDQDIRRPSTPAWRCDATSPLTTHAGLSTRLRSRGCIQLRATMITVWKSPLCWQIGCEE